MFKSKKAVSFLLSLVLIVFAMPLCVVAEDDCQHRSGFFTIPAVEATCSAAGNIAYKECKFFCGYITDSKGNQITLEDTVIPATGQHVIGDDGKCTYCGSSCEHKGGTATCTQKAVCSECSQSYGELDKYNHTSTVTVTENETAPSCTDKGYSGDVYYECCGSLKEKGVEIPETGHNSGDEYFEIDPANHGMKCVTCGVYTNEESHIWILSDESVAPTCTENGCNIFYCEICYANKIETVPFVGHSEETRIENEVPPSCSADGSYDKVTYCNKCKTVVSRETVVVQSTGEHVYLIEVIDSRTEPTCTESGSVVMMCICSETVTVAIPPKGHNLSWVEAVSPTCTTTGNIAYWSCNQCKKMYLDYECIKEVSDISIEKTGHTFNDYKYNDDAICTADGTETATCSMCKTATDTRIKSGTKLSHSFTRYISNNDATCVADGTATAICDRCYTANDTKTEVGSKDFASHKPDEYGKTCTLCGKTLTEGHLWSDVKVIIKEPSCDTDGAEAIICTDCGEIKHETKTAIPAMGHDYTEEWNQILSPSCEQNGIRIKICKNCYNVITETLLKTEHVDANTDSKCDYCGYITSVEKDGYENNDTLLIPETPEESENPDYSLNCTCSCHKDGFSKVIFNILNFFYKIFGINRVCQCGKMHY